MPRVEREVRRVVVRLPTWLGDVVMAAPAVHALAAALGSAQITLAVREGGEGLAAAIPGGHTVLSIGNERGLGGLRQAALRYRGGGFDTAVVLPRSTRALLAPRWAGIETRVGFGAPGRHFLLTHAVEGWAPWRRVHRSRWFALPGRAFGAGEAEPQPFEPEPAAREAARELLRALGRRETRPLVALEPGASYGPAKCWPIEHFVSLARDLKAGGRDVVVVGSQAQAEVESRIAAGAGGGLLRAAGRTPDLATLVALLAEADLLVANDTGPMHIAAAVGTPVLALFGATDPLVSGPLGPGPRRILWSPAPCSPCFLRTCAVPGHPCLASLGPARVLDEAERLLSWDGGG